MVRKKIKKTKARDHGIRPHQVNPYKRLHYPPVDENLENFIDNWDTYRDRLTVFVGAGASVGAQNRHGNFVPPAAALRDELWKRFMSTGRKKPNLGTMTLEHASALIETKVGATALRDYAIGRFDCELPLWQHAVLPFLRPKAVFTTNYDNLIELGWSKPLGKTDVQNLALSFDSSVPIPAGRVPLFKPHGTVESGRNQVLSGGLVLTAFDYFKVISSYQEMLRKFLEDFGDRCVLFIGYSFMDMDIGAELYRMRQQNRGVHWYVVFPRDDADVRAMYQDKFGIKQINRTFFDFITDLDSRVNFIPNDWKRASISKMRRTRVIQ